MQFLTTNTTKKGILSDNLMSYYYPLLIFRKNLYPHIILVEIVNITLLRTHGWCSIENMDHCRHSFTNLYHG